MIVIFKKWELKTKKELEGNSTETLKSRLKVPDQSSYVSTLGAMALTAFLGLMTIFNAYNASVLNSFTVASNVGKSQKKIVQGYSDVIGVDAHVTRVIIIAIVASIVGTFFEALYQREKKRRLNDMIFKELDKRYVG